jgi:alanyl-tRNA synthetase
LILLALGNTTATIKSVFHNKTFVESTADIPDNTSFGLILDKTSFYAESSGQEYDTGVLLISRLRMSKFIMAMFCTLVISNTVI